MDTPDTSGFERALAGTALDGIRIGEEVGGNRVSRVCTVYRAQWHGRECVVKIYKPGAVERHFRLTGQSIAEFEYQRNRAFFDAPGLTPFVAEPLGYVATPDLQALLQEFLPGQIYYHYYRDRGGQVSSTLATDITRIVELAHAAQLFDMDLHAMNVMVVETGSGPPRPKLFDFSHIPFYVRAPNIFVGLLLRAGLIDLRSRDLRRLKSFHRFGQFELRLKSKSAARGAGGEHD